MSAFCTVCVRGYPSDLPLERVSDKLMIHFLRARNGGGEITNIEFPPESPGCAMVTFEDATVTHQVLKAKRHVLTVNGKNYPLEVTANPTELNPNEIFVRVCMKVDYGRFPGGKDTLDSLRQQYGGIHFNFNPQEMTCTVKGSFVELQAFSSELLRRLNSKQRTSISFANGGSSAEMAVGDGVLRQEETQAEKKRRKKKDSEEEEAAAGPLPARETAESLTEPLEDFSLVIDSDIYLYMLKFCCEELRNILHQHQVSVVDVICDGITILYLRAASNEAGGVSALVSAHLALSQLSQQLEGTLRKEKVNKKDLGIGFLAELQSLNPLLLIQEEEEHFCLIGNLMDVSRAKQHIQELISARGVAQDHQRSDVPQAAYLPLIHGQSSAPAQLESPVKSAPRKLSSPKPSGKTEHKLAVRFNSSLSFSSRDSPLAGLPAGSLFQAAEHQAPESECSLPLFTTATEPKSLIGQPVEFWKAPQGMKADPPPSTPAGTVSSSEGRTSLGLTEPSSLRAVTSAFSSLNLFDTTGAADFKVDEPRPHLRRSSSLSLQKPLSSRESMAEPRLAAQASAAHLRQESQEYTRHSLQKEIRKDGLTQMEHGGEVKSPVTKQRHCSSPLLSVQRDDVGPSGMQKAETLTVHPAYLCESFTYSELAMDGPEDEALGDLCRYLKNFDDRIFISQERYKLDLAYPREEKLRVLEVFRLFSAHRRAALSKQTPFHDAQQGEIQHETLSSRSAQQPNESRRSGLGRLTGETSPSQAQRLLQASSFQPVAVQNVPSDQRAWQSEALDKAPDASKQGRSRKLIAEGRQGLPDKFHFARERSKEGSSHEPEAALLGSLPDLPLHASPPAGEGVASDLGQRTASLGSESAAEECELCQISRPALFQAPCTHKPGRTGIPGGSASPPYHSASPAIPGTFGASTLSHSLHGYFRDPTLKITYDIPDGVQQAGDPFPGQPYRGGRFEAFLPDNAEGRRLMVLLRRAFERGLTFQIKSCASEGRVTWGPIPHKTSMEGGKARNGYPDNQYLQRLSLKLKELHIE